MEKVRGAALLETHLRALHQAVEYATVFLPSNPTTVFCSEASFRRLTFGGQASATRHPGASCMGPYEQLSEPDITRLDYYMQRVRDEFTAAGVNTEFGDWHLRAPTPRPTEQGPGLPVQTIDLGNQRLSPQLRMSTPLVYDDESLDHLAWMCAEAQE